MSLKHSNTSTDNHEISQDNYTDYLAAPYCLEVRGRHEDVLYYYAKTEDGDIVVTNHFADRVGRIPEKSIRADIVDTNITIQKTRRRDTPVPATLSTRGDH
jgi:hypothetical protein